MGKKAISAALLCLLLFFSSQALATGGDVPIDSARGNYEGADNIHWYMQDTLQYELWSADPPLVPVPEICNGQNQSISCLGLSTLWPLTLRSSDAPAPIAVKLEVDSRIDFAWRYALKQVRDVNRMLSDSGINARLLVSHISSVDVVGQYNDSIDGALNVNVENRLAKTQDNSADIIITIFSPDAAGATSSADFPNACAISTQGPGSQGSVSQGPGPDIQVIASACEESIDLARQLGYTFGLVHESGSASSRTPFIATGIGYIDQDSGVGTVMSTASLRVPLFSSPSNVVRRSDVDPSGTGLNSPIVLGSMASNSVDAANSTVWAVALANETAHDSGFDYQSDVFWDSARGAFSSLD